MGFMISCVEITNEKEKRKGKRQYYNNKHNKKQIAMPKLAMQCGITNLHH